VHGNFVETATLPTLSTWTHICITRDSLNTLTLYYDGQFQTADLSVTQDFATGSTYVGSESVSHFDGKISDVCFFDHALSVPQIESLVGRTETGAGNPMVLKPTPVAYYPLGDNSSGGIDVGPTSILTQPNVSVDDASVFDFGGSDYIDVSTISLGTKQTLSWWINRDSSSTQECPFGDTTSGLSDMLVYMNGLTLYYRVGSTSLAWTNALSAALTNQKWCNIILIRNGASAKLYLNSDFVSEQTLTGGDITAAVQIDRIGASSAGTPAFYMNSKMSNIAIWNTDQTLEVNNIYNSGIPATSYTNTPTAWYKLDQSANWEADSSGNWQIPDAVSAYPQSFKFVRTSSAAYGRIFVHDGPFSYPTGKVSASIWFKWNGFKAFQTMIADDYNSGDDRIWWVGTDTNGSGKARFVVLDTAGNYNYIQSSTNLQAEKWYHIAVTYDGTTNADAMKLYLNNQLDSQGTTIAGGLQVPTSVPADYKVQIGHQSRSSSQVSPWGSSATPGELSNACIWDTTLEDSDVEALYNNGTPLTTAIQSANLKGWWKLDDTELFDNTNWSIENQVYPSNWESALDFDGTSSYIDAGQISAMDGTADYTISLWFKPAGSSGLGRIVSTQSNIRSPGPDIYYSRTSGTLSARVGWSSGSTGYAFNGSLASGLDNDTWHNLIIVVDIAGLKYTAYVNGGTGVVVNRTGYSMTGTFEDLKIGSYGNAASSFWNGEVSNVVLWDTDQTSEISNIYNNGTPATSYTNTPISWWKLDNLTTGLQDSGSGGNNAK